MLVKIKKIIIVTYFTWNVISGGGRKNQKREAELRFSNDIAILFL